MNAKSPISALQELMAAAHKPLPVYIETEGSNVQFQCTVHVDGISASGSGLTKKTAKHASAEAALKMLTGSHQKINEVVLQPSPTLVNLPSNLPAKNYIGELNEFSSCSGVAYPEYSFVGTLNGQFVMNCSFMGNGTQGFGSTKKIAKQDCAKNMLEKVQGCQKNVIDKFKKGPTLTLPPISQEETRKLEQIFNEISLTSRHKKEMNNNISHSLEPNPNIQVSSSDNLDKLSSELESNGIDYDIHYLQKDPIAACVCVKNTVITTIGIGKTKEQALKIALIRLIEIVKTGFTFNDILNFT